MREQFEIRCEKMTIEKLARKESWLERKPALSLKGTRGKSSAKSSVTEWYWLCEWGANKG